MEKSAKGKEEAEDKGKCQSALRKETAREIGAEEPAMPLKKLLRKWKRRPRASVAAISKAAKNEKIKLRAAFCNNIAAGAAVGGAVVPYVALVGSETASLSIKNVLSLSMTDAELQALVAMMIAFSVAFILRIFADSILNELQD